MDNLNQKSFTFNKKFASKTFYKSNYNNQLNHDEQDQIQ